MRGLSYGIDGFYASAPATAVAGGAMFPSLDRLDWCVEAYTHKAVFLIIIITCIFVEINGVY